MICCEVNLLSNVKAALVERSEFDVVVSTFANLASQFQRYNNVVSTTFIVHHDLNLLSHIESKLEQHCNFGIVASTSLKICVLVVRCCNVTATLSQHCVFSGLEFSFSLFLQ